jgi:6-phosphogluconolactonase (cycloisomerase 2 family)
MVMNPRVALYTAVDEVLTRHEVDVEAARLTPRESIRLPAKLQYLWRHPSRRLLYATVSRAGPRVVSDFNQVLTFAISSEGRLSQVGEPRVLPRRAVHLCTDPRGRYLINAHNFPNSGVTIHRLDEEGLPGEPVDQDSELDFGCYPHQVRVTPSGKTLLIVDRGNKPDGVKPEDPGALRSFEIEGGRLWPGQVIAPHGGFGFGPRHVDFHPLRPWLYASDERFNRLHLFRMSGEAIETQPAFSLSTLADHTAARPRQIAGPIHVHPSGRVVYVANRADHTVEVEGVKVFAGGENNLAVFAIDPQTGEPRLIQHADTWSFHVRTFSCDPSGRLLVAASIKPLADRQDGGIEVVPAALTVFRILEDGQLDFVAKQDVETAEGRLQYWSGLVSID